MHTLEKDWDSYNTTIYTDGAATHGNTNGGSGIIVTTGPRSDPNVHRQSTTRPANGAHSSKPKRKLCKQPSSWYRRMSPSTRCASLQIVCQHSYAKKICIHPSELPTPMKTRFLTLWLRLPTERAISLSHGAPTILDYATRR